MSDLSPTSGTTPVRRAPLVTIVAIFALFALFAFVVYYLYVPRKTGVFTGSGFYTEEQRNQKFIEHHAKETEAATTYGWVDQNAGVVRLPLQRAEELTLQQYAKSAKKP